ncbi:MAG: hypothetical protein KDA81_13520 [Planctomycetaceae bacterium]|nr:hypothetical protein [Planctomycetaceae bacterium]
MRSPALAIVASLVLGAVPSVSSAEDKAAVHTISFGELIDRNTNENVDAAKALDDGDKISVTDLGKNDQISDNLVEIRLKTGTKMWWKGIVLYSNSKGHERIVELTDADSKETASKVIKYSEIETKRLCFSKAKALGVRADMYELLDASKHLKPGHSYLFIWHKD